MFIVNADCINTTRASSMLLKKIMVHLECCIMLHTYQYFVLASHDYHYSILQLSLYLDMI